MAWCACGHSAIRDGSQCDRCIRLNILGLGRGATTEEIKEAYRTLVRVWHPDRFQSDEQLKEKAGEKLADINSAYEYLIRDSPSTKQAPGGGAAKSNSSSQGHAQAGHQPSGNGSTRQDEQRATQTPKAKTKSMAKWKVFVTGASALCLLIAAIFIAKTPTQQKPASIIDGPVYLASLKHKPEPSPNPQADTTDELVRVDATTLLTAYQTDESGADERYKNKRVAVTGMITGLFIPSVEVSLRMAEKGHSADAFITMGGPRPSSVEDTLLIPGINAYSETSSLFGRQNTASIFDQLKIGATITLICTCRTATRVSDLVASPYSGTEDYSVTLEDCTQENDPQENSLAIDRPGMNKPEPSQETGQAASQLADQTKATGSTGGENQPERIGGSVSAPVLIHQAPPEYSEEARTAKVSGNVLVDLWVDEHGNPTNVRVLRGLGSGLDEKAVEAVQQYRFEPATENGKPVAVELNVEVNFQIF